MVGAAPSQAPTGLTATTADSAVSLTWAAPTDDGGETITDYQVEYKKSADATWNVYNDGASTSTSAMVNGLDNETLYDFRVSAINASGVGATSNTIKSTPLPSGILAFFDPMNAAAGSDLVATQPQIGTWSMMTASTAAVQISSSNRIMGPTIASRTSLHKLSNITMSPQGVYGEMELNVRGSFVAGRYSAAIMLRGTEANGANLVAMYNGESFRIMRFSSTGTSTVLATQMMTLTVGQTYKVRFEASPGSQKIYLDGSLVTSSTDPESNYSSYGSAVGVRFQTGPSTVYADTIGPQIQKIKFGKLLASAPTSLTATEGAVSPDVDLSWTKPADVTDAQVLDYVYEYRELGGTWAVYPHAPSTATSVTITGLDSGKDYEFRVAAVTADGQGEFSAPASVTEPSTAPDPPTGVSAVAGNANATISFTPPVDDGGSAITSYTVTSSPGGITASGSGSPITVTGLANGTSYTFTVTATNAIGVSLPSVASNAVTPVSVVVKLAVFGDSITVGMNASPIATNSWANIYSTTNSYTLNNKGISGTVLQNSLDSTSSPRANNGRDRFVSALLGANRSDKYVIMYGLNDLRYTASTDFNVNNYRHDYAEILSGLIRNGISPTDIVLASPTWIPDAGYSSGSAGFTGSNRTIHESYVAAVASLALEYGTKYVDTYTLMRDSATPSTLIDVDNIHPNNTGHAFIANAVQTAQTIPNSNALAGTINASSPSQGRLTVNWTAPSSGTVTGYEIEHSDASGSYDYFETKNTTGLSVTFEGLAAGNYFTRVRPVFAGGVKGPWLFTSTSTLVLAAAVPAVPTGLNATAGNASVLLSWTAPADNGASITDYVVQYRESPSGAWATFSDGTSTATSATVTGLTNGTAYDFRVSAVNSVGQSSDSSIVTQTPVTVPAAPTDLVSTRGDTQVLLSWTAPAASGGSAITDYIIEFKASSSSTWATFSDGTSTATNATVTGLTNGTGYDFRVSATNSVGTGLTSGMVSATPATVPDAPVVSATPTAGGANLSWTAPSSGGSAITDYIVQYKLSSDSTWSTFADGASASTSAMLTGLMVSTAYDFRVIAVNAVGNSVSSAVVSATTLDYNVAIKYGDVALADGATIGKRPNFTGTADPGSTVQVTINPGSVTCDATADASGNWNCTPTADLAPGNYTVSTRVTLPLGDEVNLGPYSVNVKSDANSDDDTIILPPNTGIQSTSTCVI